MKRFAIAAVLVATLSRVAIAQPVPGTPLPYEPTPGLVPTPNVFVRPGTPPGPAIPFHKSGGVVVGAYGFYPYDTGEWLLGGSDDLTRQSGSFTMVYPGASAPATRGHFGGRHGFFRR